MVISNNLGTVKCTTFSDYQAYILKCVEHNSGNEIWCSSDGKPESYPCLSILVKGKEAVVNYFSEGNLEMFVSLEDVLRDGTVEFENGQYELAAYLIIATEEAVIIRKDLHVLSRRNYNIASSTFVSISLTTSSKAPRPGISICQVKKC